MAFEEIGVKAVVKGFGPYQSQIGKMEKKTGGFSNFLKTGLKAGAIGGATALAGLGLASLKMGMDFEKSMAEVKTLLPTISKEAFGKMKDDVLDFSKEMGIATDKAVPALYQAISAGVPRENVMEFMTVASKAAIGGVTELETAVDGITSVVNAYGAETLSAQKASDIMFTGVRLGKTTFDELSASLFNVVPSAVSLGISFEEVTGSLAALTAQGIPTSVATTSLRMAFVEASKGGSKLDLAIKELAGKSFADLIAAGQTGNEVFQMLRESMPTQAFRDLFGSQEALNAILPLTGAGFESAAAAIDEAGAASGATNAAFETMEETTARKLNKAINALKVELTKLGSEVLPVLVDWYETKLIPAVKDVKQAFDDWRETMGPTIEDLKDLKVAAEGFTKAIGKLDIDIGKSEKGFGKFAGRNAALRIQIGMLTEAAEMWTALLEGRWLDALKNFVQVGLVPFQVAWETTRGVVATVMVAMGRAVEWGLNIMIRLLNDFTTQLNKVSGGIEDLTATLNPFGGGVKIGMIDPINEVNFDLEEMGRHLRGTGEAMADYGAIGTQVTNPMMREFIGLNEKAAVAAEGAGAAADGAGVDIDGMGGSAGGAADEVEDLADEMDGLAERVDPIAEMFSIMAGNIDAATSSIKGLLGIQTEEEAQIAADIAALELEIELIDQFAGETVELTKAQQDSLYWWERAVTVRGENLAAIEDEIEELERLADIEGELSKKKAGRLKELKEERDALEDSIEELQGKIDGLKKLAGSETDAGKAAREHIEDLEDQIDAFQDDQDEIDATKKALGTFMDAEVEGRLKMDTLTGSVFAQGKQLGLWKGEIDKLPPALRDWYRAHAQTVFDISLNFNHLLLVQRQFVDESDRLAAEWAAAWADAANAAFAAQNNPEAEATPLQSGGYITRGGLAMLHAGETVLPRERTIESVRDVVLRPSLPAGLAAPPAGGGDFNANISVEQGGIGQEIERTMRRLAFSLKGAT